MLDLPTPDDVPLATAAFRIGVPYAKAYHQLMIGNLAGRRVGGRWFIARECVEQLETERAQHQPTT